VLQLVQPQFLLLLLQDQLLAFQLVLEVLAFSFQGPDLLVALLLDIGPLPLELLDLVLELRDDGLVDLF
jgi:hypothetical protein